MPRWIDTLQPLIERATVFLKRYPGLVALFGFVSGLASFFLVDRQAGLAKVIAAVMLVSWIWLALGHSLHRWLERRFGLRLPPPLLQYATQMIHQESLFFILPFFIITTSWNTGQALFTGVLGGAALVSILDPIYYRGLAPRRWLYLAFHSLTLFAVLLTALPIILQLDTAQSYRWALGIALLLALPSLAALTSQGWRRWLLAPLLLVALAGAGWLARLWVPPATLWLNQVAIAHEVRERAPAERLQRVSLERLNAEGLYAYTAINAPRGLSERIQHVWRLNGQEVDRITLSIQGGREDGYRAWTHKRNFPADPRGKWQVQVLTEAGQLIGMLRFEVE
ncbi:MAG TPA: DUF5924 family protein [Pseudomonas sp.]|jgi:hypothetical protein|nr:DUF5924 family protein [Pseudomonas sp.]